MPSSYHLPGQFTPGAYGSSRPYGYGSRLYGRIVETPDAAARDCEFTACFVSDILLAAKLGPETASNNPKAIATTCNLAIVLLVVTANLLLASFVSIAENVALYLQLPSSHLSVTGQSRQPSHSAFQSGMSAFDFCGSIASLCCAKVTCAYRCIKSERLETHESVLPFRCCSRASVAGSLFVQPALMPRAVGVGVL